MELNKPNEQLRSLWQGISNIPGWLRLVWLAKEYTGAYTEEDLRKLEAIDDEFLGLAKEGEECWWKDQQRLTDKELLEVFPEVKEMIPQKIQEWEKRGDEVTQIIRKKLALIMSWNLDQFSRDFWRNWLKINEGQELLKIEGHIARLKRLLLLSKGEIPQKGITEEAIQQALAVPIENIAYQQGIQLRKSGKNHTALCPFHSERNPSFYIYPETHSFYCFSCQKGGDVITFAMLINDLDFKQAVLWLDNNF